MNWNTSCVETFWQARIVAAFTVRHGRVPHDKRGIMDIKTLILTALIGVIAVFSQRHEPVREPDRRQPQ